MPPLPFRLPRSRHVLQIVVIVLALAMLGAGCEGLQGKDPNASGGTDTGTTAGDATGSTDATDAAPSNRLLEAPEVFAVAEESGLDLQSTTDPTRLTIIRDKSFVRPGITPPPEVQLKGVAIGGEGAPMIISVWTDLSGPRYAQRIAQFDLEFPAGKPCPPPSVCATVKNVHVEWAVFKQSQTDLSAERAHIMQFVANLNAVA